MLDLEKLIREGFGFDQLTSEAIVAALTFLIAASAGLVVYYVFAKYISRWAKGTKTSLDDELLHTLRIVVALTVIVVGSYYSLSSLSLLESYSVQVTQLFTVFGIFLVAFALTKTANALTDWYARRNKRKTGNTNHILFILKKILQIVIYIIAFLGVLAVFNYDLSGVVVGLGVGGIAVALAVQSLLSDVFSSFSIYFDRPFEIGDFIVVGNYSGTVTNIGVRSTRIRLLQGEELVISNKELVNSCVRNFKKLEERRVAFTIGVTYDTPIEKLKAIPAIIAKIFDQIELADLDRVHFVDFGDFSLKFEVVYVVKVADYYKHMDVRQAVNYAIKEEFEKENIVMAFPTQTILIEREASQSLKSKN